MPKSNKKVRVERSASKVEVRKPTQDTSLAQRLQTQFENNQSYLSLILGLLIVFVVGILVFNYVKKHNQPDLIPAQQTTNNEVAQNQNQPGQDVSPDQLPGKYTIKAGDTLFNIAKKYYNDGYRFPEIVKANSITNEDQIEVGQVLDIPKLADNTASSGSSQQVASDNTNNSSSTDVAQSTGTGGAENQTIWGEKITGDTYTVVEGDWLSKISGRAYGDIMKFDAIAKANNIQNPDVIEPGMVLKIPR